MAGAIAGVYKFDIVVRGLHVYKTVWTLLIDETLQVYHMGDTCSDHDECAVDDQL